MSDPVSSWPQEAVAAAMERGDIAHWRRIAAEIRRSPWGRTARAVEEILTHSRPYGVAELMERAMYLSGKVVPSAAMLVRMERAAVGFRDAEG